MISLKFILQNSDDEIQIGRTNSTVVPRIGETIWLQHNAEFGSGPMPTYKVVDVCYWTPNHSKELTGYGYNTEMCIYSVAIYVEPTFKEELPSSEVK